MKIEFSKTREPYLIWLRILIITILALGIFFRFVNIERKVYWLDETYTSLRISGNTRTEYIEETFNGQIIGQEDLQKYLQVRPEKNLVDTIEALAGNSEHPPLYYLMARFWVQWFGNTPAVTRTLSALISLLAFPCIYWLCQELFQSSLTAWIAVALVAISPFHLLYAQEARQYSLWIVTILLSCASLLYAMRVKTKRSWIIYAATISLGLYTFLFSALVAIAQGVYVAVTERFRLTKVSLSYLLASLLALIAFTPWLLVMLSSINKIDQATSGVQDRTSFVFLAKNWVSDLGRLFLDFEWGNYSAPIVLIIVGYSLYFLSRNATQRSFLFVVILMAVTALPLILADLILGLHLSVRPRYLIPSYLSVELAVAYLISNLVISASSQQRKIGKVLMALLISGGIVSCAIISQTETWWNKGSSGSKNPEIAQIINQAPSPLVVSSYNSLNPDDLLSLSYRLQEKLKLKLIPGSDISEVPEGFSHVFLYNPSQELQAELEKNYKIELIHERFGLLEIKQ